MSAALNDTSSSCYSSMSLSDSLQVHDPRAWHGRLQVKLITDYRFNFEGCSQYDLVSHYFGVGHVYCTFAVRAHPGCGATRPCGVSRAPHLVLVMTTSRAERGRLRMDSFAYKPLRAHASLA